MKNSLFITSALKNKLDCAFQLIHRKIHENISSLSQVHSNRLRPNGTQNSNKSQSQPTYRGQNNTQGLSPLVLFVSGPPGTGKSFTLSYYIKQHFILHKFADKALKFLECIDSDDLNELKEKLSRIQKLNTKIIIIESRSLNKSNVASVCEKIIWDEPSGNKKITGWRDTSRNLHFHTKSKSFFDRNNEKVDENVQWNHESNSQELNNSQKVHNFIDLSFPAVSDTQFKKSIKQIVSNGNLFKEEKKTPKNMPFSIDYAQNLFLHLSQNKMSKFNQRMPPARDTSFNSVLSSDMNSKKIAFENVEVFLSSKNIPTVNLHILPNLHIPKIFDGQLTVDNPSNFWHYMGRLMKRKKGDDCQSPAKSTSNESKRRKKSKNHKYNLLLSDFTVPIATNKMINYLFENYYKYMADCDMGRSTSAEKMRTKVTEQNRKIAKSHEIQTFQSTSRKSLIDFLDSDSDDPQKVEHTETTKFESEQLLKTEKRLEQKDSNCSISAQKSIKCGNFELSENNFAESKFRKQANDSTEFSLELGGLLEYAKLSNSLSDCDFYISELRKCFEFSTDIDGNVNEDYASEFNFLPVVLLRTKFTQPFITWNVPKIEQYFNRKKKMKPSYQFII